jgi:hypothetical protein
VSAADGFPSPMSIQADRAYRNSMTALAIKKETAMSMRRQPLAMTNPMGISLRPG